ncbi:MAG: hypothetical protein ACXWEJ_00825 [Actinomycetota bacterium]
MGWVAAGLVIALAAFTVVRLVRSWGTARGRLDSTDPPRSGPA